ncbi:MAG: hypothetical protein LKJ43_02350 [Lentilactobacillus buchneri]|jgi:peptidoglycan hydrolase CwlO-like protein|uniref:YtxH domain-containing protein n=2 Tax=Lentilactobacillus hilgardii TaxID=1588 RepID=A0A6P1EAJ4_LENHI|nr:hypothetical protein [Lentilactobacillus hilgardii]MCI1923226.1 hypothetical protein [Lentilactobacillus buchneri]RRG11912.1 MAG: hypothetical protein DUD35_03455 [Lactobacillus sp.]EEI70267.1 hypothetical protein HMPREF0496_2711 [Lentilactobacillus hilgardii ATCC 27305]MCI1950555.1 hypothetical protein [Lentilactobacillus buchneri]MCI2018404.1 hypothetical protein [Lentilactobacillus buchneri]
MKTGLKMAGAAAFLFGVYLYTNKETPEAFAKRVRKSFRVKRQAYSDWQAAYEDFKQALNKFKDQIPELEKVLIALQRDIDEAQFQIQPRIDEINKYSSKINKP